MTARLGAPLKKGTGITERADAARRILHITRAIFQRCAEKPNKLTSSARATLLRLDKNTEDAIYERACIQTWATCLLPGCFASTKGKVRLSSIVARLLALSQEIHVLHTELFHEEQGKACSCFFHLTTHFTVFQRSPRLYKAVAEVLC